MSTSAFESATQSLLDSWIAFATVVTTILVSIYAPGMFKRIPVLLGLIVGYAINFLVVRFAYGESIDFTMVNQSRWFGVPHFVTPKFEASTISIIVPVCVVLLAENLGHLKAVAATVETSLDKYIGRAIIGDAVATIVSAAASGPGTTTYAENIGVMVKNETENAFLAFGGFTNSGPLSRCLYLSAILGFSRVCLFSLRFFCSKPKFRLPFFGEFKLCAKFEFSSAQNLTPSAETLLSIC